MKLFLVLSKQTRAGGEFYASAFKTKAEAIDFMEELTTKDRADWTGDDFTVYEDADYFECEAQITEEEL